MTKNVHNYDRYKTMNAKQYGRKKITYWLMRRPADRFLLPYIDRICNKTILEVGCGYGYYTRMLMNKNLVEGADINPELGKQIGIKIYKCTADFLSEVVKKKYNYVLSFWMTEYLSKQELKLFIREGISLLEEGGKFATTVFVNRGIGKAYIWGAKLKGISKYCYSKQEIEESLDDIDGKVKITELNSIFGIPCALFLEVEK